jgi:PAS domain S-box-containing protein
MPEKKPRIPIAAAVPAGAPGDVPPPPPPIETVLADQGALWEAVQRVSGEFIAVVDPEGIVRWCNRVEEGFGIEQIVGKTAVQFNDPESSARLLAAVRDVVATAAACSIETTIGGSNGDPVFYALRLGPIYHAGRIAAVLICCENIRSLKKTEQTLQHERTVLRRLLEIQERERQLVSYEIHDGLAQYLAGALMHLEAYRYARPEASASPELDKGTRLLRAAAEESRRLIAGLRPPALDELGIVEAIESLVADARLEIPAISFSYTLPGERLPASLETTIFRIVQESLSNARKHSEARVARVTIDRVGDAVKITVRDEGRGFDPGAVPDDRFGLEGIRQRCRLFGAEPRIESAPGRGTTIEAVLPILDRPLT